MTLLDGSTIYTYDPSTGFFRADNGDFLITPVPRAARCTFEDVLL